MSSVLLNIGENQAIQIEYSLFGAPVETRFDMPKLFELKIGI